MQVGALGVVVVLVAAAEIVTPRLTVWLNRPFAPVTARVKEPVDAVAEALIVSVDEEFDPEGGVTGPGKLIDTPEGAVPIQE
ncbi:MAG: hypothetical protein WB643_00535 [Candidatus Bathyarchaeia archaeon]